MSVTLNGATIHSGAAGVERMGSLTVGPAADGDGAGDGEVSVADPGGNTSSLAPFLSATLPPSAVSGVRTRGAGAVVSISNVADADYKGPVTVTLYVSADETLQDGTDPELATVKRRLNVRSAETTDVRVRIGSLPSLPDGEYRLIARLTDVSGGVGTIASAQTVVLAAPRPDLSGSFASLPPLLPAAKRARLTITVTNAGNVPANVRVPVAITAAPDAGGGGAVALPVTGAKLKLKPGQARATKISVSLPAELRGGSYFLTAVLDPTNLLVEQNETNNTVAASTAIAVV